MRTRLEAYFHFAEHKTNWRTEFLAGATTFITMAYIIFVNPSILAHTGMDLASVTIATCLCAAFGSILYPVPTQTQISAPGRLAADAHPSRSLVPLRRTQNQLAD